jgi:hypothetical protein
LILPLNCVNNIVANSLSLERALVVFIGLKG